MKARTESVLHAYMRHQTKKKRCIKCNATMVTFDEPEFYIDNVCVRCGKDILKLLKEHGSGEEQVSSSAS